jgi:2-polyprenyl-6-methoxyphenol hydroxylase-like FAD-dependent oxidoreductase
MTQTTRVPVLVVGGGIGGLAAALALAQAGHEVRRLEQAREFVEVGAGVQLAPNATRALAQLGILEQVEQHAVRPQRLVMMDAVEGRQLTELDVGEAFRARYGAPYIVMHRHDLLIELLEACRADGRIVLENDKRMTAVRPQARGAVVECADGSVYECDAVVAADGLRSTVRSLVVADEPICSEYVAYRGPVPIDRVLGNAQMDSVMVWVGPGLHLVQYPLRRGELYNQVAVFRSDRYTPDGDDWGTGDELLEPFSKMCPPVAGSIELLDQSMRWPMYDRLPIDNWTRGAVTLLGDAAHPMLQYLAQGACQALVDAVQLAADFTPGRDPEEAFLAYQAQRIPPTARVQTSARSWGELWHIDGVGRHLRNRLLALREPTDYTETDWLYGSDALAVGAGAEPDLITKGSAAP